MRIRLKRLVRRNKICINLNIFQPREGKWAHKDTHYAYQPDAQNETKRENKEQIKQTQSQFYFIKRRTKSTIIKIEMKTK